MPRQNWDFSPEAGCEYGKLRLSHTIAIKDCRYPKRVKLLTTVGIIQPAGAGWWTLTMLEEQF